MKYYDLIFDEKDNFNLKGGFSLSQRQIAGEIIASNLDNPEPLPADQGGIVELLYRVCDEIMLPYSRFENGSLSCRAAVIKKTATRISDALAAGRAIKSTDLLPLPYIRQTAEDMIADPELVPLLAKARRRIRDPFVGIGLGTAAFIGVAIWGAFRGAPTIASWPFWEQMARAGIALVGAAVPGVTGGWIAARTMANIQIPARAFMVNRWAAAALACDDWRVALHNPNLNDNIADTRAATTQQCISFIERALNKKNGFPRMEVDIDIGKQPLTSTRLRLYIEGPSHDSNPEMRIRGGGGRGPHPIPVHALGG